MFSLVILLLNYHQPQTYIIFWSGILFRFFLYKAALLFLIILYYSLILLHVSLVQSIPMFYNTNLKEHERDWINLPFGLKSHFLEKVVFLWTRCVIWCVISPAMTRGVLRIKMIFSFCPSVGKFSWSLLISFLWYIVWY